MIFIFYLIVLNVKLSLEGNYFFTSRLNSLGSYCMMGYVTPFQYNGIFTIELQNEMSFTTNENIANNCDVNLGNHDIQMGNEEITALRMKNAFTFYGTSTQIKGVEMFYVNSSKYKGIKTLRDSLSFAYKTIDNPDSMMSQLIIHNLIDKYKISFIDSKIYFGEYPFSLEESLHKGECDIAHNEWGCYLNNIYYNNKLLYKTNAYARINANDNKILVPKDFFKLLAEKILYHQIEGKTCTLYENKGVPYYLCYCGSVMGFPKMKFGLGKYFYEFDSKAFFEEMDGFCFLLFEENKNDNGFVLGESFLKKFSETFDFDNKKIEFYSSYEDAITKEIIVEKEMNNTTLILRLFYILYVLLCVIIIIQIIIKTKHII